MAAQVSISALASVMNKSLFPWVHVLDRRREMGRGNSWKRHMREDVLWDAQTASVAMGLASYPGDQAPGFSLE